MDYGTWTDKGAMGVSSSAGSAYNAIDANVIAVGSSYYLTFESFWNDIYQVALNSAATNPSGSSYQLAYTSVGSPAQEVSFIFYYNGYYYLLWRAEYKIKMVRSTTAAGNFVDMNGVFARSNGGSVFLASYETTYGPGGQGGFTDGSLGLVLYYHYAKTTVGLGDGSCLFGWNKLSWSNGWQVVSSWLY
ncbi:glycosyl hydrolase [Leptodontidium sp. MPI-SDFR-AT-0119]|nr:glycosyl hydrolase [Leptodontidium sp. MPI-SDFR-AT-0119]